MNSISNLELFNQNNLALLDNEIIQFKSEEKYCIKFYDKNDNVINTYYTNKQECVINNNDIIPHKISVCQVNGIWGDGVESYCYLTN